MTFNVGIGTTLIAMATDDGIPYLWKSGDVSTAPSNETKITASDAAASDEFGNSVAVGSGRIVVGAKFDDIGSNSNQGSAYIFDLSGNQLAKLTASDGAANDEFGHSVAVGCGRVVVGAYRDSDNGFQSGSAYIYDLDGNNEVRITPSDPNSTDRFGYSVAVGCGRIVVGSYQDDDDGSSSGSAYIFDLSGTQLAKITASDAAEGDRFGYSVAVGSGRIVVGAYFDDIGSNSNQGSAYIFDLSGTQLAKLTASDGAASDNFGQTVAVGCGRVVVGAAADDIGSNSNQGSAYIFDLSGNQLAKLTASDGAANDLFGQALAVGCGRIVVGSYGDDDDGNASGSVYLFDLEGNLLAKITASDAAADDYFGYSVAVGCGKIVVGATRDDEVASATGSVYLYDTPNVYTPYDIADLQSY